MNTRTARLAALLAVASVACASESGNAPVPMPAPTLAEPPVLENPTSEQQVLSGANARIEFYRKGFVRVMVWDSSGKPVPNAVVKLEQTRHAFLFGANIFLLNPDDSSSLQRAYQDRFVALFNYATLPFYWGAYEPERGKPNQVGLEGMARWSRDRGLVTKGHPLVWQQVYPDWAAKDAASAIPLLQARVTDIVGRFKGLIDVWDVVNEANAATDFDNGVGAWARRDGPAAMIGTALGWAQRANPNATLLYNDFDTSDKNLETVRALEKAGKLPDVIGIQSHMHGGVWPVQDVWKTTDAFSGFKRPVHFTETTVLSGSIPFDWAKDYDNPPKPWPTTPEGEAAQASNVTKFYTTLFSHPNTRAITWWDFSDRDAWLGAPSGLVRADMSPKPAYNRLMGLIRGVWWTNTNGTTDVSGSYLTRAFLGAHRVTVSAGGQTKTADLEVGRNGNGETVLEVKF